MLKIKSSAWKLSLKWFAALGILGCTIFPIIIYPIYNPTTYQEIQKKTRKNIVQEKIQPGNMKVWTDPFDRKKPSN